MPRKWVGVVAGGPQKAVAYGVGKSSFVRLPDGTVKEFREERTVEAIAFAPKGLRIAVARYNGVTLHWVATAGDPVDLEWKGAHTGVTFSPDGKFLVTTMQENALHGWKMEATKGGMEARHMRMTGYPAKVKSVSWSAKGKWLASSGAPAAIVWPFSGKDGPMGKAPEELGTRANIMVTNVAFHPVEDVLAIGFIDGMILGVRLADGKEACCVVPARVRSHPWTGAPPASCSPSLQKRAIAGLSTFRLEGWPPARRPLIPRPISRPHPVLVTGIQPAQVPGLKGASRRADARRPESCDWHRNEGRPQCRRQAFVQDCCPLQYATLPPAAA
ncbi:hypothetical protein C241_24205 [Bradyrhizobium lupini HPC(L)]|uniref:WD40 repeat domain-containing protein n=1 Tax=Bradyrhizobium lupini HPC(L) TaxID=1229491 RepID=A0ABP2RNG3_RHILU|nr:hypothetical protein C241_24205 [Bradyrhizobium lupini HPC(L)]